MTFKDYSNVAGGDWSSIEVKIIVLHMVNPGSIPSNGYRFQAPLEVIPKHKVSSMS